MCVMRDTAWMTWHVRHALLDNTCCVCTSGMDGVSCERVIRVACRNEAV